MVLTIVFAPSGRPTPHCRSPAHLATDSFFAATADFESKSTEKRHHEKRSVSTCGFGEWCGLSSLEVLQHRVWA